MVAFWCFLLLTFGLGSAQTATSSPGNLNDQKTGPEATVTFYSGGTFLHTALPFTSRHVFMGCIFEQKTELACITWRRYAVVKLAPGIHIFSASLSEKHGAENSQTALLVEAGKSYYLRTTDEHKVESVVPTTLHPDKGFLEVVSCEVAEKETADSAPAGVPIAGKDWAHRPRDGAPACAAPTKPQ